MVISVLRRMAAAANSKKNVIFVLGPPGAGKGTQCAKIIQSFPNYAHLSAGDLLRAEQADPNSTYSAIIRKHITSGTIVPVEITCQLIQKAMLSSDKHSFLIDGFPRSNNNLEGWNQVVAPNVNLACVLYFECNPEMAKDRCVTRGLTSGREDDNEQVFVKRFNTYVNETTPILEHFKTLNLLKTFDASLPVDAVFEEVSHFLSVLDPGIGDS